MNQYLMVNLNSVICYVLITGITHWSAIFADLEGGDATGLFGEIHHS